MPRVSWSQPSRGQRVLWPSGNLANVLHCADPRSRVRNVASYRRRVVMRKFLFAVPAIALGIALSAPYAAAASSAGNVIVVHPGQSIQAAVNHAQPGDTVLVEPGVYQQAVIIRTDGITLRGSGNFHGGTVIVPPSTPPNNLCTSAFGPTGVCILAKKLNMKTGAV